jgi:DNA mismatch repair protein MutS
MSLSLAPPREASAWKTPLYEQFWGLKDQVPDALLFFRLGDFYELFGDDALKAAPLLEVQLTARNKNHPEPIPMCGVPVHALDSYAERLLSKGFKIAIADQEEIDESSSRKLVERKIVRILTPGLPIDYEKLQGRQAHWLVSLARKPRSSSVQILVFDLLGSRLFEGELESAEALKDTLLRLQPKEILIESSWFADPKALRTWGLDTEGSQIKTHWTAWGSNDARKNLEEYVSYTQRLSSEELRRLLPESRGLSYLSGEKNLEYAQIPQSVLEQWAVVPELFDLLDKCGSVIGSRRLREWLSRPLMQAPRIRNRQSLLRNFDEKSFLEFSREVYDLERLLGRFRLGVAQSLELLRFRSSFKSALAALKTLPLTQSEWQNFLAFEKLSGVENFTRLESLAQHLDAALLESTELKKGLSPVELLREGYDAEFDRLQGLNRKGEEWLHSYEERLRKETGIASLKVRNNRVFGYYIEVTKTHLSKVPDFFERKQTTVQGERFTTEELRHREREILTASARAMERATELLEALIVEILSLDAELKKFVELFSWADAFAGVKKSLSFLKVKGPWIFPEIVDSGEEVFFEISEARHPLLEALYGDFIPNSLSLGKAGERIVLLTGPNMAGKSTLMRQTGLCLLLGQCGLPVPASQMKFAPCSGFYSRMGASDRILAGESTFMVEMKETASILREADAKSFVLIDEIGRGTSTTDGLAIARAVLEYLHDHTRALCIFATHYHELSEDAERLANVFNASMGIREWEGELVFLRKLVREAAHSSYGLYVAQWAGLPSKLLARAEKELKKLQALQMTKRSQVAEANQISLFGVLNDDSKVQKLSQENEKLKIELRKKQELYDLLRKDLRDLLLKLDEAPPHSP